jgi:hypothetical protein
VRRLVRVGRPVDATGLLFSAFYILTALATVAYYRRRIIARPWDLVWLGVLPLGAAGLLGWIIAKSMLQAPANQNWAILGVVVVGFGLMFLARFGLRSPFFAIGRPSAIWARILLLLFAGARPVRGRVASSAAEPANDPASSPNGSAAATANSRLPTGGPRNDSPTVRLTCWSAAAAGCCTRPLNWGSPCSTGRCCGRSRRSGRLLSEVSGEPVGHLGAGLEGVVGQAVGAVGVEHQLGAGGLAGQAFGVIGGDQAVAAARRDQQR